MTHFYNASLIIQISVTANPAFEDYVIAVLVYVRYVRRGTALPCP